MNTQEAIETLKRLRLQVDMAIKCIEAGAVFYDKGGKFGELLTPEREQAFVAHALIGDFLIFDTKKGKPLRRIGDPLTWGSASIES